MSLGWTMGMTRRIRTRHGRGLHSLEKDIVRYHLIGGDELNSVIV